MHKLLWQRGRIVVLFLLMSAIPMIGITGLQVPREERRVAHELLPPQRSNLSQCHTAGSNQVRALLIGVDDYPLQHGGIQLTGASNDATLLANTLIRQGVTDTTTLSGKVERNAAIQQLMALAKRSNCGDTLLLSFSGHAHRTGDSLLLMLSDAHQWDQSSKRQMMVDSPTGRSRTDVAGAIDASELADYFDRLRMNGVNVVFICDAMNSDALLDFFSKANTNFWVWRAQRPNTAAEEPSPTGAYFGMYAGMYSEEWAFPLGSPVRKNYGRFSWFLAAALNQTEHPSFRALSRSIVDLLSQHARTASQQQLPVFETSHPQRFPLATGLPTTATGESVLRSGDSRRFDITTPAMQRGATRVGAGSLVIEGRVVAPTPPTSIQANQVLGRVNPDGSFRIQMPVQRGENHIMLAAAWDDADFLARPITVISQTGENLIQEGKRYAILVANQDYQDPSYPNLETPVADASALAHILERDYGFATSISSGDKRASLVLKNAKRNDMYDALRHVAKVIGPQDSLLVFYAGHGVYEKQTNNAYWLPVDAQHDQPENWVSDKDLASAISRLNVRHVLVIADSCFSGAFRSRSGQTPAEPDTMSRIQFLDQANLRPSRTMISSGANEPVADGGGDGHSIFARALLNGLSSKARAFTAGELMEAHIKQTVSGNSGQMPQYFPMKEGHEGGEFIFVPVASQSGH